jgi:hypothetical protein
LIKLLQAKITIIPTLKGLVDRQKPNIMKTLNLTIMSAALAVLAMLSAPRAESQTYTNVNPGIGQSGLYGGLTVGPDGKFYGTFSPAGTNLYGGVFRFDPLTTNTTILHYFAGGTNGDTGWSSLVFIGNTMYGSTLMGGGTNGESIVFRMNSDGSGYKPIFAFSQTNGVRTCSGPPVVLPDGTLAIATINGGNLPSGGFGVVDCIDTNGTWLWGIHLGHDNGLQTRNLCLGTNGLLYGATWMGGPTNIPGALYGCVYEIDPVIQTITNRYCFTTNVLATLGGSPNWIGVGPDGNFYVTTADGMIVRLDPVTWTATLVKTLRNNGTYATDPQNVIWGADGAMYVGLNSGGSDSLGTIYRVGPVYGTPTILHDMGSSDNNHPWRMTFGSDGRLWGVNTAGGVFVMSIPMPMSITSETLDFNTNGATITWSSVKGQSYVLSGTTNLSGGWLKLSGSILASNGSTTFTATNQFAAPDLTGFYRVGLTNVSSSYSNLMLTDSIPVILPLISHVIGMPTNVPSSGGSGTNSGGGPPTPGGH